MTTRVYIYLSLTWAGRQACFLITRSIDTA